MSKQWRDDLLNHLLRIEATGHPAIGPRDLRSRIPRVARARALNPAKAKVPLIETGSPGKRRVRLDPAVIVMKSPLEVARSRAMAAAGWTGV